MINVVLWGQAGNISIQDWRGSITKKRFHIYRRLITVKFDSYTIVLPLLSWCSFESYVVRILNCWFPDIDECTNNPCNQWCKNTVGGYICHCHKGYKLQGATTCIGRLKVYFILFTFYFLFFSLNCIKFKKVNSVWFTNVRLGWRKMDWGLKISLKIGFNYIYFTGVWLEVLFSKLYEHEQNSDTVLPKINNLIVSYLEGLFIQENQC